MGKNTGSKLDIKPKENTVDKDDFVTINVMDRMRKNGTYDEAKIAAQKASKQQNKIEIAVLLSVVVMPFLIYLALTLVGGDSSIATRLASMGGFVWFMAVVFVMIFAFDHKNYFALNLRQFADDNKDKLRVYLQDFVVAHYGKASPLTSFGLLVEDNDKNDKHHSSGTITLIGDHMILGNKKTMSVKLRFNNDLSKLSVFSYTATDYSPQ